MCPFCPRDQLWLWGCELFSSTRRKTFVERYNILQLPYCINLSNELGQNVKKQMKLLSWNPLSFLSPQIYKEGVEWDENTKENISRSVIKNTKSKSRIKSCQQKFCNNHTTYLSFLPFPGIPGIRSLGLDVCQSMEMWKCKWRHQSKFVINASGATWSQNLFTTYANGATWWPN